jgi:hypothetical protein
MSNRLPHTPYPATPQGVLWVCSCCLLEYANGECCEMHGNLFEAATEGADISTEEPMPWSLGWKPGEVTMGMLRSEHEEGCNPDEDCACEYRSFTWSSCDGCGSPLGGDRYAFTYWS